MTNPNDQAFIDAMGEGFKSGLTKREYFAAMVFQGFAANPEDFNITMQAKIAVAWADALIAELSK